MQRQMPSPGIILLYSHPCSHRSPTSQFLNLCGICWWRSSPTGDHTGGPTCSRVLGPGHRQVNPGSLPIRLAAVQPILRQTQSPPTPAHRAHLMPVRSSDGPEQSHGEPFVFISVHYAFFQIQAGLPDPSLAAFPRLTYVLKEIHRTTPEHRRKHRLPITLHILRAIHGVWSTPPIMSCCGQPATPDFLVSCALGSSHAQQRISPTPPATFP